MIHNHTGHILTRESVDRLHRELSRLQKNKRLSATETQATCKDGKRIHVRLTRFGVLTAV